MKQGIKRGIALLLTVVLLLGIAPVTASAAQVKEATDMTAPGTISLMQYPSEEAGEKVPLKESETVPTDEPEAQPELTEPEEITEEEQEYSYGYILEEFPEGYAPPAVQPRKNPPNLPTYYDSREYGYITSVKNQGAYGTCWAHAAMAACEAYMIKHGVEVKGQPATTDLNLSEYHLAWYAFSDAHDKLGMLEGDTTNVTASNPNKSYLSRGGSSKHTAFTLMRWEGLATEDTSELQYKNASPDGLGADYAWKYNVAHVQDAIVINQANQIALKQAIMKYGAGVYSFIPGNYATPKGAYYNPNDYEPDHHAVTVVGWDDDYNDFDGLAEPPKNPGAWIVKNSWGDSWGTGGYGYISYEDLSCADPTQHEAAFYTVEPLDKYVNNYQYDGAVEGKAIHLENGDEIANVFTANGTEELRAVSIESFESNADYLVSIYKNPTEANDPTSGTLAATQSGTFDYVGYHTVELNTYVSLEKGDRFAVVVAFTDLDNLIWINVSASNTTTETNSTGTYTVTETHKYRPNTSVWRYNAQLGWHDYSQTGNFRIKAYTWEEEKPCLLCLDIGGETWRTIETETRTETVLPDYTGTVPNGYRFVGWTDVPILEATELKPTLYTGTYNPISCSEFSYENGTPAVTLYAYFEREIDRWVLLEREEDLYDGMQLVLACKDEGVTAADSSYVSQEKVLIAVASEFSEDGSVITSLNSATLILTAEPEHGDLWLAYDNDCLELDQNGGLCWSKGTTYGAWQISVDGNGEYAKIYSRYRDEPEIMYNPQSKEFYAGHQGYDIQIYYKEHNQYLTDIDLNEANNLLIGSVFAIGTPVVGETLRASVKNCNAAEYSIHWEKLSKTSIHGHDAWGWERMEQTSQELIIGESLAGETVRAVVTAEGFNGEIRSEKISIRGKTLEGTVKVIGRPTLGSILTAEVEGCNTMDFVVSWEYFEFDPRNPRWVPIMPNSDSLLIDASLAGKTVCAVVTAEGFDGEIRSEGISISADPEAHEHTIETIPGYLPTCTSDGRYGGEKCSTCGMVLKRQYSIPALGHDLSYTNNGKEHTATCSRCSYSVTAPHYFDHGVCVCGARLQSLTIESAAPILHGRIDIAFTARIPDDYTNAYMRINGKRVECEEETSRFVYTDINPQFMGDNIEAVLYATKDGKEESVSIQNYSVRQYCVNMLANEEVDGELRTLISDMLAYGAAAQIYTGYKTDELVTEGEDIINPQYSNFKALSGVTARFTGTADESTCWVAAGLTLTDSVAMNLRFYAQSTEGLEIRATINGRTQTFNAKDFAVVQGKENTYEISFTSISAEEFADTVTAAFYQGQTQVGNSVSYSVNAFIQAKQNSGTAALQNLVRALYNYGAAAKAYAE